MVGCKGGGGLKVRGWMGWEGVWRGLGWSIPRLGHKIAASAVSISDGMATLRYVETV